jgi:hypothetical protein
VLLCAYEIFTAPAIATAAVKVLSAKRRFMSAPDVWFKKDASQASLSLLRLLVVRLLPFYRKLCARYAPGKYVHFIGAFNAPSSQSPR